MAQLVIHVTSHMFLIKGGVNIKTDILEATKKFRVTAILRGIENDRIRMVIDALYEGGIRLLEITYDQKSPTKIEDTTELAINDFLKLCDKADHLFCENMDLHCIRDIEKNKWFYIYVLE